MICAEFNIALVPFLQGVLSAHEQLLCEQHLLSCEVCLEFYLAQSQEINELPRGDAALLTARILNDSAIQPCLASEDLLCDFIDGNLAPEQAHFLQLHLSSCEECAPLQSQLLRLRRDLRALQSIEPPPQLLAAILHRTLPWPQRLQRKLMLSISGFQSLLLRPRFALETAFTLTIFWLTLFGVPASFNTPVFAEQPALELRTQISQSLVEAQNNFETELRRLPPLLHSGIDSAGSYSTQLLQTGIDLSRQSAIRIWQVIQAWSVNTGMDQDSK